MKKIDLIECNNCGFKFDSSLESCPKCELVSSIKESPLIVKAAVTARFTSEKGSDELTIDIGREWPLTSKICLDLIGQVEAKFKAKIKFHSFLSKNKTGTSVPTSVRKYIDNNSSFRELVAFFLNELKSNAMAAGTRLVTGGNLVFMHYKTHEEDDVGKFFAILVSKKDGFDFEQDTQIPKSSSHIDLSKLKQAVRIDLTLFDEVYPEPSHYLQFIQGTSKSEFFKIAFGCNVNNVDNAESVEQIRQAVVDFGKVNKLGPVFSRNATDAIEKQFQWAVKNREAISIDLIIQEVEQQIPNRAKNKGLFTDFLTAGNYRINPYVQPSRKMAEDGNWVTIETDHSSFKGKVLKNKITKVGDSVGSNVEFDVENKKLVIKLTDPDQIAELTRVVEENAKSN